MPDSSGVLTPEEKEKAENWIAESWSGESICPVSGHNSWQVADHIVQPVASAGAGLILGVPNYPQVMLVCQNCGYTMYFNAVVMGLMATSQQTVGEEVSGGE